MFSAETLIHVGRGIAWAPKTSPTIRDSGIGCYWSEPPSLAHFGSSSLAPMDSTLILLVLSLIAGIICIVLGVSVFFRRAVWRNQEKRGSDLLSLDLNGPRNNLAADYVLENECTNVFLEPRLDEDQGAP